MTSVFQVLAHEDNNDQAKARQAMALATQRVNDRFGPFVRRGSVDDQATRFSLVEDDINEVVIATCLQVGYDDSAGVYKAIANNFVTSDAMPQLRTASVRHEARKPKMCPYHSEVTDISLASGNPQDGFNAMAQHAWGAKHCQGEGYEGDRCKFKPEMTTQAYWSERAEKLEQKRQERAERAEQEAFQVEQPVQDLPQSETPAEEFVDALAETDSLDSSEPSAIGEGVEEAIPMAMAAMVKEAPGKHHMPGVSDKRNRQYEHIKEQCLADGGSEEHCKEMAARTVNKQRSEKGETKDSSTHTAETAVPKMDKRKWTPTTVREIDTDDDDGRSPTRRKDVTMPIHEDQGERFNPSDLKEIGEQVTERQDVGEDTGPSNAGQGGTFGGGERSAVSGVLTRRSTRAKLRQGRLLDPEGIKEALAKFNPKD